MFLAYLILRVTLIAILGLSALFTDVPWEIILESLLNAFTLEINGGAEPSNDGGQPGGFNQGTPNSISLTEPTFTPCLHSVLVNAIWTELQQKTIQLKVWNLHEEKLSVDGASNAKTGGINIEWKADQGQKVAIMHSEKCLEGEDAENYKNYYISEFERLPKEFKQELRILRIRALGRP